MVEVVAHRGVHGDGAGENAAEAFARAVDLGVTRLETDVHLTADGVLVALHDETLDRTTDGAGAVADRTWAELASLQVRGGGRVPRLDELLAAWPHVGWVLDAKVDAVVEPLATLLAGLDRPPGAGRISVGAFDVARHRHLRRVLPDTVDLAAGRRQVQALVAAARTVGRVAAPLLRRLAADVVQVPVAEGRTRIIDRRFVEVCHAAGLPVEVWTVDDPAEMRRLIRLGVDALITDRAAAALAVVAEVERRGPHRR